VVGLCKSFDKVHAAASGVDFDFSACRKMWEAEEQQAASSSGREDTGRPM
jgi:hypothetical protein